MLARGSRGRSNLTVLVALVFTALTALRQVLGATLSSLEVDALRSQAIRASTGNIYAIGDGDEHDFTRMVGLPSAISKTNSRLAAGVRSAAAGLVRPSQSSLSPESQSRSPFPVSPTSVRGSEVRNGASQPSRRIVNPLLQADCRHESVHSMSAYPVVEYVSRDVEMVSVIHSGTEREGLAGLSTGTTAPSSFPSRSHAKVHTMTAGSASPSGSGSLELPSQASDADTSATPLS